MAKDTTEKNTTENETLEVGTATTDTVSSTASESGAVAKTKKRRRRKKKVEAATEAAALNTPQKPSEPSKLKVVCVFKSGLQIDEKIAENKAYVPIFGGKIDYHGERDDLRSMLGDDDGDNISRLNPYVGDITAMYWIWKHYEEIGNPEYIGFCKCDRPVSCKDDDLSEDTVLANDRGLDGKTVYEQYKKCHDVTYLDKFGRLLKNEFFRDDIKWLRSYDRFLHRKSIYADNVFIMPRKAFFEFMDVFMSKCIAIFMNMDAVGGEIDTVQTAAYNSLFEYMTSFYIYHMSTVGNYKVVNVGVDCV